MGMKKRAAPVQVGFTHHLSSAPGKNGQAPTDPRTFSCSANGGNLRNRGSYDWDHVGCRECLKLAPPEKLDHYDPESYAHVLSNATKRNYPCGASTNVGFPAGAGDVTCPKCIEYVDAQTVPEELEDAARILISNALIAAKRDGREIAQTGCHQCRSWKPGTQKDACVTCAVASYRGLKSKTMIEDELARILGLPYEWVLDMLGGFDGQYYNSNFRPAYKSAVRTGKRLWRKYGKQKKARRRA